MHYSITEPRPFSTKYKSHKLEDSGLTYEYCLAVSRPRIVSIVGLYPAGTNDKDMVKRKLKGLIEQNQQRGNPQLRVIADKGYSSKELSKVLTFRNEFDPSEVAYFKDRALSRHERFNGWTKDFKCLANGSHFHYDRVDNPKRLHLRHKDAK